MGITADALVGKYVELRDRKTTLKKAYDAEVKVLDDLMEKIETKLQEQLEALGVNSFNTDHGTVFRTYKESATVGDWTTVLNFIKENEAWELLERRVNKTFVKEVMEENRDGSYRNPPPPGVNFTRLAVVQVRRKS